jgi:hypothetical protein
MGSSDRQFFTSLALWQKSRRPRQLVRYSKRDHHVASFSSKARRICGLIKQPRRPIACQILELARDAQVKPTLAPRLGGGKSPLSTSAVNRRAT